MPVWLTAAARSAVEALSGHPFSSEQTIFVPERAEPLKIEVRSASVISGHKVAIGITNCHSTLGLDLTRNLEIWACVSWKQGIELDDQDSLNSWLEILPGAGVGKYAGSCEICISSYAKKLLETNLRSLVPLNRVLTIEIIFPQGADLALRTSNQAFGVVDGLAVIGTQAEAQISSSPEHLTNLIEELKFKSNQLSVDSRMTFVIGENGLNLAISLGISKKEILKIGNWVGPLLVSAAENGIQNLLLMGYHGKLIKLAGGIFHTHHHLADARLEVLASLAIKIGMPINTVRFLLNSQSVDDAFVSLHKQDPEVAEKLWNYLAIAVQDRTSSYIKRYGPWPIKIGVALFDRQRTVKWVSPIGHQQLLAYGVTP